MKRSIALAGLMVLAAASSASAQGRHSSASPSANACEPGTYSVVQAPDGSSVSILFHDFVAEHPQGGTATTIRRNCYLEVPLAIGAGMTADLTTVDYRGFAQLASRQSMDLSVAYDAGPGIGQFRRRIQGRHCGDFAFTDRIAPGQLGVLACGMRPPVLRINASLTLSTGGQRAAAMASLDSADMAAGPVGALTYRFTTARCRPERPERPGQLPGVLSD